MLVRRDRPARLSRLALAPIAACTLSACGVALTAIATSTAYDDSVRANKEDFGDPFVQSIAENFGIMALFAYTAYRTDLQGADGCAYLKTGEDDRYGMPTSANGAGRWMRWRGEDACVDDLDSGLFYETYVFRAGADRPAEEAVIAFRGTENTERQFAGDWASNLSALLGIEPAQYRIARAKVPAVIHRLRHENPAIRIHAVGHSLGGGLAQQAGYQCPEIASVMTFNTSPVTNWTRLKLDSAVGNRYPLIYRIYHGGEFLENVRFVTTSFTATRYNVYDLRLQFEQKSVVGGHSMDIVACTLGRILGDNPTMTDAPHHYGRDYIRQSVVGGSICAAYFRR